MKIECGEVTHWRFRNGILRQHSIKAGLSSQNKLCKGKPVVTLHADAFFGISKVTIYQYDMVTCNQNDCTFRLR